QGTASFISNKGRNAFVAGEKIQLKAAFRSTEPRPAGERTITLTHPNGEQETIHLSEPGTPWFSTGLELAADRTRRLAPGKYELSFAGLPEHIVAVPFSFDLTARQSESLFHVVKSSKYT